MEVSLESNFTPVVITARGRTLREAFDKANRPFDLFRWLLNLFEAFGMFSYQYGGYPKPLGKILLPPIYGIFKPDGQYQDYFYNTTKFQKYRENKISIDQVHRTRKLASQLVPPKSSNDTVLLLIEAVEKYGQALDTTEWRLAFLVLWQIIELITLQSAEMINMKTVVNRIVSLLQQDQLSKDLLLSLYETRNALVHRGHFPDEQGLEEVNFLKWVVERSINALFARLRVLPTVGSLMRFYDHASTNSSELADRKRIISYVQRRRSKS